MTLPTVFPRDNQPMFVWQVRTNDASFTQHDKKGSLGPEQENEDCFSLISTAWKTGMILLGDMYAGMYTVMPYDWSFLFIYILILTMWKRWVIISRRLGQHMNGRSSLT